MRHNEEAAKKQKLQHPQQQHSRLPPQQHGVGQSHAAPLWPAGPNHPMNNNAPPPQIPAGGHYYGGKPRGGAPVPNRYPPSGNQTGGYNNQSRGGYSSGAYPPQGRGAPYGAGPRGPSGGYGVGPPNYSQGGGQYGGSGGSGRGQNPMGGARNQQYGWQP
nr:cdc2-like protein kinase [Arabidopsis thaliana]